MEEDATISEDLNDSNQTNSTNVIENVSTTVPNETDQPQSFNSQSANQEKVIEVMEINNSSSNDNVTVLNESTENQLDELIFDQAINDESTIQFMIEKSTKYNDESTSSSDYDESSGDSEQIINFGSTETDETSTDMTNEAETTQSNFKKSL